MERLTAPAGQLPSKEALEFRPGELCILKSRPCRIIEFSRSKPGKHGTDKVRLLGVDLFTARKYEDIFPSTRALDIPAVDFSEYPVMGVETDGLVWFGTEGEMQLNLPKGMVGNWVCDMANSGVDMYVRVMKVAQEEMIVGAKVCDESHRD